MDEEGVWRKHLLLSRLSQPVRTQRTLPYKCGSRDEGPFPLYAQPLLEPHLRQFSIGEGRAFRRELSCLRRLWLGTSRPLPLARRQNCRRERGTQRGHPFDQSRTSDGGRQIRPCAPPQRHILHQPRQSHQRLFQPRTQHPAPPLDNFGRRDCQHEHVCQPSFPLLSGS